MSLDADDKIFPSVRLLHIAIIPDATKIIKFKEEEMEVETTLNENSGIINMIGRKRIMSEEHKISFLRSFENDDPWIFDPKDFHYIKYMCSICHHVHTLDIVFVHARNLPSSNKF